ncbi:tubulin polyglutamylase TTLL4 [Lingula anatina]|uniref:Tubulin polyglutamylase TTLL4 n=1 Tax=Lingula anatina TaxID=7574 RepID=A0A1S3HVA9_LINAN|nr:tubulin polyglutamylase TTLL4 [Lingula anatina]|eukprot:XP_013388989.1 tubulin polyglutamylase TTLL4 [Lingula anatina]
MTLTNNWTTWAVLLLGASTYSTVRCTDNEHCSKPTSANGDLEDCLHTSKEDITWTSSTDKVSEPLLPALTPSLFSNVPPYINFIMPGQQKEPLPENIRRRLFWYEPGSPIISATANRSGYALTKDGGLWSGCYTGCYQPHQTHMYASIEPSQKYNHFPNNWAIGCKDRLAHRMRKMKLKHGKKNFNFHPSTYIIPDEMDALRVELDLATKGQLWILKPPCFHGGRGIEVIQRYEQIPRDQRNVIQRYITNPYLIDGYKFDLRIYVHIASIDPLRVYIYPDGIVKFATKKFTTGDLDGMIHLTNNEINTKNPEYTLDHSLKTGHKWSISTLWEYLKKTEGIDHEPIWEKIKDIVIKTIITGEPEMYDGVKSYLKSKYSGHELLGFDILLDEKMDPWILEVNIAPGILAHPGHFHPVNDPMARDLLNIAGFRIPSGAVNGSDEESGSDVPDHLVLDKRWWSQTLSTVQQAKQRYYCDNHKDENIVSTILENLTPDDIRVLVDTIDENSRRGGFDRIFPRLDTDKYFQFFEKPRYHNLLVHEWLKKFHENEEEGIALLESHCKESKHLSD